MRVLMSEGITSYNHAGIVTPRCVVGMTGLHPSRARADQHGVRLSCNNKLLITNYFFQLLQAAFQV